MTGTIVFEFIPNGPVVRHCQVGLYEAYRAYEKLLAAGSQVMLQHEGKAVRASWGVG